MTGTADAGLESAPLAVAQEGMWYRSLLEPTLLTYNETVSIRKDGPLDVDALRRAFEEFVRRHEAWHTTFETVDGVPVQVLRPTQRPEIPEIDLSQLSQDEAERRAVELITEVSKIPYDLTHGPLVRPRLYRFPGEHHRLYLAMHHLVFDGYSLTRVVLPELVTLYQAYCDGGTPALPEPEVRYSDYARWEQRWIDEPRTARRLEYWRDHLGDAPVVEMPFDRPRPAERSRGGGAIPLSMMPGDVERLRAVGQSVGATLFQVLAAAWSLLLSRSSGKREVVFATAAVLRQRPELEGLVGCCLTPLAMRVPVNKTGTFADLVVQVRNELLEGLDRIVPFERVVRELPPAANPVPNPVYQTMIVLEPETAVPDPSWSLHQIDSELVNAVGNFKLDLELQLEERADGLLGGELIFDRDLFDTATAERLVDTWLGICEVAARAPGAELGDLAAVPRRDRRRMLVEWNATTVPRGRQALHNLIEARAALQPESIAISDGEREVSYAEIDARAGVIAARLVEGGVNPGEVVAVASAPSPELVAGALGALKAGAAHLLLDPVASPEELRRSIDAAGATATLAAGDVLDRLDTGSARVFRLDEPERGEEGRSAVDAPPDSPCVLGFEDRPDAQRARATSHAAAVNLALTLWSALDFSTADRALVLRPSIYRTPVVGLWLPLVAGARVVLAPEGGESDGGSLSRLISTQQVNFMHASGDTWRVLIESGFGTSRSLRSLCGGRQPLDASLAAEILDRCRVLWNAYGSAQTGLCTIARLRRGAPVTIGRPISNVRAYVLTGADQPAEIGAAGELVVAADGPLTQPFEGSDPWVPDPFARGIAYRTGDRARWLPHGELELLGSRSAPGPSPTA